jgi:hypothetical protein
MWLKRIIMRSSSKNVILVFLRISGQALELAMQMASH